MDISPSPRDLLGRIGRYLRPGLQPLGWSVHCLDLTRPQEPDDLEWYVGDVKEPGFVASALKGCDTVVHLAGIPVEADLAELRSANLDGTYQVTADLPPRPDSLHGVTKVVGEALGSLYADRYGMDVAAVRIGSCFDRPPSVRGLATWWSPGDCVRLFESLLCAPSFGHRAVYGASANTRARGDLAMAAGQW